MIDLYLLSKYRTQLMGIAALFIVICHAPAYGVELPHYVKMLFVWGNVGVDMFLFLSGLGCYYSLSKWSKNSVNWIVKRYRRIAIPYIVIQLIFLIYFICCPDFNWISWLLELSTVSFWTEHAGCWYVAFLIPLYALTPLLFACFKSFEKYRHAIFILLVVLTVLLVNTGNVEMKENTSILYNIRWTFKRFPGFIFGMYLAPYILQKRKIKLWVFCGITLAGFLLFNFMFTSVYGWWFYVPMICVVCCAIFKMIEQTLLNSFLIWIGGASLESYVTNIQTKAIMPSIVSLFDDKFMFYGHYLDYVLVVMVGMLLTYYSHKLSNLISQKL